MPVRVVVSDNFRLVLLILILLDTCSNHLGWSERLQSVSRQRGGVSWFRSQPLESFNSLRKVETRILSPYFFTPLSFDPQCKILFHLRSPLHYFFFHAPSFFFFSSTFGICIFGRWEFFFYIHSRFFFPH